MQTTHPTLGKLTLVLALAGGLSVAAACGGGTPPADSPEPEGTGTADMPEPQPTETPTATATGTETAPTATAAPAKPKFDDMSHEQKMALMKDVVLPKATGLLQEVDPKKFADVKCATCHGPGVKDNKYDMPNAKLPKLDSTDSFAKHKKKSEKMLAMMMEKFTPAIAEAIGEPLWSPETPNGFGCGKCHTMVAPKAPPAAKGAAVTPPAPAAAPTAKPPAGTKATPPPAATAAPPTKAPPAATDAGKK
jgi:hypothetical protein